MQFISKIEQLLCSHKDRPKRTDPRTGELFLSCLNCSWTSTGIETGPGAFYITADREIHSGNWYKKNHESN